MRCLNRNKRPFYYALYQGREAISETDEYGNTFLTGEYRTKYSEPILELANISPASGTTVTEIFGGSEGYDKVLILAKPNTPIDEYSILWIDEDTESAHDYIVKKVSKSLNSVAIAASKVNIE